MSAKKKSSTPKTAQPRSKRSEKQREKPRAKAPATAIWTREAILSLSEEDFSRNILVPLFRAMGYQEVRYSHGGSLEQGKDLVMWKANEFGVRRNYAVIVKAEPIGGSATVLAKTVLVQVQQAVGSRYLDEVTREEHRIHEVILASSHEVSKEADTSIHNALEGAGKDHLLSVLAGERLWEEISKHLPDILLFSSLAEAQRALSSVDDPDWHVTVQLAPEGTQFSILPRRSDVPPITVSFEAHFPESDEGRVQREAFDKFLATGAPAEINAEYLKILGLPELPVLGRLGQGILHLGPTSAGYVPKAALILQRQTGEEILLFPRIEFGDNRGGREEVTLSNAQQDLPFKFTFVIPTSSEAKGQFSFNFDAAAENAYSAWQAAQAQREMARGGTLIYQDCDTGFRFQMFELAPGEIPGIDEGVVDLWRKVALIQRRSRTLIPEPDRQFFSPSDIGRILTVEQIMDNGEGKMDPILPLRLEASKIRELFERNPSGIIGQVLAKRNPYVMRVLETAVPLGRVEVYCARAMFNPAHRDALRERVNSASDSEVIEVEIVPAAGEKFTVRFLDWPNPSV